MTIDFETRKAQLRECGSSSHLVAFQVPRCANRKSSKLKRGCSRVRISDNNLDSPSFWRMFHSAHMFFVAQAYKSTRACCPQSAPKALPYNANPQATKSTPNLIQTRHHMEATQTSTVVNYFLGNYFLGNTWKKQNAAKDTKQSLQASPRHERCHPLSHLFRHVLDN